MRSRGRMRSEAEPLFSKTTRERVRWSDVDMMGVVYFGAYLRFMEAAEAEFFRSLGFTYGVLAEEHGVWLARVRLEMDYRSPARLDDEIETTANLVRTGGSSLHLAFSLDRAGDGARLVDGKLVLACVDREKFRPARIPASLVTAIGSQRVQAVR